MTDHDHRMFAWAARRGPVTVDMDGNTYTATLIAWKPRRHNKHQNAARVRFTSGRELTVRPAAIVVQAIPAEVS